MVRAKTCYLRRPAGINLGSFLFNVTTDDLEEDEAAPPEEEVGLPELSAGTEEDDAVSLEEEDA